MSTSTKKIRAVDPERIYDMLLSARTAPAPRTYFAVQPPSTAIAAPVIDRAASEHRNATTAEISSTLITFLIACLSATCSLMTRSFGTPGVAASPSAWACNMAVSTKPGQMALQVMPQSPTSSAVPLVKPTTPCFEAMYGTL